VLVVPNPVFILCQEAEA